MIIPPAVNDWILLRLQPITGRLLTLPWALKTRTQRGQNSYAHRQVKTVSCRQTITISCRQSSLNTAICKPFWSALSPNDQIISYHKQKETPDFRQRTNKTPLSYTKVEFTVGQLNTGIYPERTTTLSQKLIPFKLSPHHHNSQNR